MAEKTLIAWTDHTMNPWMGCTKVAPGCTNCYAEIFTGNRMGIDVWGPKSRRQMTGASIWSQPKKWNKAAEAEGRRHRVFCASLCDVFEDFDGPVTNAKQERLMKNADGEIVASAFRMVDARGQTTPEFEKAFDWVTLDDVRRKLFEVIDATPWLDWQLLTKRPENIRKMWPCPRDTNGDGDCAICANGRGVHYRQNVWLGTSISEQESTDENIPKLLMCQDLAPVLFVSYEPALGPVDFGGIRRCSCGRLVSALRKHCPYCQNKALWGIDWLICGGESGPGFRPMDLDWARAARDQCAAAGVPFFFKQSSHRFTEQGIELDGQIVRQYPTPRLPEGITA